jgi:hypothetical protein
VGTGAAAIIFLLIAAAPAAAQLSVRFGEPTSDPKAEQIKVGLERKGEKVLQIGFQPAKGSRPPGWGAVIAASYAQPSHRAVLQQGFRAWDVMYAVVGKDDPSMLLFNGQVWTKYMIVLFTATGSITKFLAAFEAAKTDEEKDRASTEFLRNVGVQVADLERAQFIDQKDFINKNFTR